MALIWYLCRNSLFTLILILSFFRIQGQLGPELPGSLSRADSFAGIGNYPRAESILIAARQPFLEQKQFNYYVKTYTRLVRIYEALGNEEAHQQAIKDGLLAAKELLPKDAAETGLLYMMRGEWEAGQGRMEEAHRSFSQALSILQRSDDYEDLTWCHCDLIMFHYLDGNIDSARVYLEKGKEVCQEHLPPGHDAHYTLLDFASLIFGRLGDFPKALETAYQSLELQQQFMNPSPQDSIELGNTYNAIALLNFHLGAFPKAISYYEKAISLFRSNSIAPPEEMGLLLNNLALAYKRGDQIPAHFISLHQAKDLLTSLPTIVSGKHRLFNFSNLAESYLAIDSSEKALGYLNLAFEEGKRWGFSLEIPFSIQGDLARKNNDLDLAQSSYQQSIEAILASNKEAYSDLGHIYLALGQTLLEAHSPDSAIGYLQKSIENYSYGFIGDEEDFLPPIDSYFPDWRILKALETMGHAVYKNWKANPQDTVSLHRAQLTYLRGIEIWQGFRAGYQSIGARLKLTETGLPLFEGAVRTTLDLYRFESDDSLLVTVFQLIESSKCIALLESQWEAQAKSSDQIPVGLRDQEEIWRRDLAFYRSKARKERQEGSEMDSTRLESWNNEVFDLERKLEKWEIEVTNLYPEYQSQARRTAQIHPRQVSDSVLAPGEALLEFFSLGDGQLGALLLWEGKLFPYALQLPPGFSEQVNDFLRCLSDLNFIMDSTKENFRQYSQLGYQFYEQFLSRPLEEHPGIQRLLIVGEGQLLGIPFETFLTKRVNPEKVNFQSAPYMLHKMPLRYGHSATLLLEAKRRPVAEEGLGLLAFAPFDQLGQAPSKNGPLRSLRDSPANLPGAFREVKSIAELGFEGRFIAGDAASESQFKELAHQFNVLHLAMHGQSNLANPLYAGLQFSDPAGESQEDGILHSYELLSLSLRADLAVLSACETGLGKLLPGEGLMSLGRNFIAVGTRSVVTTLWKVEDGSSSNLMIRFYQHLSSGKQVSFALHQAKVTFLNEADSRTAHPFFWSGFVCYGNARPVKPRESIFLWVCLGLALTLGGLFALRNTLGQG